MKIEITKVINGYMLKYIGEQEEIYHSLEEVNNRLLVLFEEKYQR